MAVTAATATVAILRTMVAATEQEALASLNEDGCERATAVPDELGSGAATERVLPFDRIGLAPRLQRSREMLRCTAERLCDGWARYSATQFSQDCVVVRSRDAPSGLFFAGSRFDRNDAALNRCRLGYFARRRRLWNRGRIPPTTSCARQLPRFFDRPRGLLTRGLRLRSNALFAVRSAMRRWAAAAAPHAWIAACSSLASVGKLIALPRNALVSDATRKLSASFGQQQFEFGAEPLAPVAQVASLVREDDELLTVAHVRVVIDAMRIGSCSKKFHASQALSTMSL